MSRRRPVTRSVAPFEPLEDRRLMAVGVLSQQIIVDQFGWRSDAARKVAIFADPQAGQNAAVSYTPGSAFQVRRASDDGIAFSGQVTAWNNGATDPVSGDRAWQGDFSALTAPGEYYVYDPANNARSFNFRLGNGVFNDILRTSVRTFYYQRSGTAVTQQHGGNWNHPLSHAGPGQDLEARLFNNGTPGGPSTARNVSGGWYDAGDYNKYVPYTTPVLWDLLSAYEWNSPAFGDNWNIPQSGNGVPDVLDEVKYETDWLLRMQTANGSVLNRVGGLSYDTGDNPAEDTQARFYTQSTTWATASFAASTAHAARVFQAFNPNYANTLRAAAERAWDYLQATPNMTPANGQDGGGTGGGDALAATPAGSDAAGDQRLRVLAAAELYRTTGAAEYNTYFVSNYDSPALSDPNFDFHPILANRFDASVCTELNRALVTYATTPGANTGIVGQIKTALRSVDDDGYILGAYRNQGDPYRAFMWDGHYAWGSNRIKAEWGNLLVYARRLNVNPNNNALYREAAEEYLHYFHGRNPLSWVYLSNMGSHGANLGGDRSVQQIYHGWFHDQHPLYDGTSSTFGPAPGFVVGGPNQFFSVGTISPPAGEPPMKAYRDWNTGWPENSWEITEPAIYYQSAYTLLLSQFATAPTQPPTAGSIAGAVFNDADADGVRDTGESALANWRVYIDADRDNVFDANERNVLTDAAGNYRFGNLPAGTYRVVSTLQSGWRRTAPTGGAHTVTLGTGQNVAGKLFGLTQRVLISGFVYNDLDRDGTRDSGEPGLSGWRVYIDADNDGVFDSTERNVLSDSSGNWAFRSLPAGTYIVKVQTQSGWTRTEPAFGDYQISLANGRTATGVRFGVRRNA